MGKSVIDKNTLLGIANAIREQEGSDKPIKVENFAERIRSLIGGGSNNISVEEYMPTATSSLSVSENIFYHNFGKKADLFILISSIPINEMVDNSYAHSVETIFAFRNFWGTTIYVCSRRNKNSVQRNTIFILNSNAFVFDDNYTKITAEITQAKWIANLKYYIIQVCGIF